tara:strand:+ start:8982 stop:9230 length:249 start_codon:yes stop_codon:yes gene_type:complete
MADAKTAKTAKPKALILDVVGLKTRDNAPLLVCKSCEVAVGSKIRAKLNNGITYIGIVHTVEKHGEDDLAITFDRSFKPESK